MKKAFLALFVIVLMVAAGGGAWWYLRQQGIERFSKTAFGTLDPKVVQIPSGTAPKSLAQLLAKSAVVSSADDFYFFVRKEKAGPRLKAGEYEFAGSLTPEQVLAKIIAGQVKTYRFTVPEGLRVDEIIPILVQSDLKLDSEKLAQLASDRTFVKKVGVPASTLEGFLFPDTYTFTRPFTEESVLSKMASRALEEYRKADAQRASGIKLNLLQTVTLGSIIEKETGAVEERPRISCVFHNRLKQGIKLQTDPTVLYAMMLKRGSFVKNITREDLVTPHPYNTYTTQGLPPGPIASPGAAALKAALNPLECDDLFFVSRNDGTHLFCPTLACHNAAVEEWQRQYFHKKKRKR